MESRTPSPPRRAKVTLLLASTLGVLSVAVTAPSLPDIKEAFRDAPHVELLTRLVLTVPPLFIVLGAPWAGIIADRWGRKPLLLGATVLYAVAGTSGFYLPGLASILLGRALLGISIAGTMTAATTLISDVTRGGSRRWFLGEQGAFIGGVGAVFVLLGGWLADLDWRTPFLLYALPLALLPAELAWIREPSFEHEPTRASRSARDRLPYACLWAPWAIMFSAQVLFYLSPIHAPFLLRELGAQGPGSSGMAVAFLMVFYAGGSLLAAPAWKGFRREVVFFFGWALVGSGYVSVSLQKGWLGMLPGLAVVGIGLGLIVPNVFALAADRTREEMHGRAMGSVTTFLFLGQFLSPLLSGPLVEGLGLEPTFGVAGVGALLAGVAMLLGGLARRRSQRVKG